MAELLTQNHKWTRADSQSVITVGYQCEVIEADSLKSTKIHLARQMSTLKFEFDSSFEKLPDRLNGLTGEILVKALGDNPQKKDRDCLNSYWLELQLGIAQKTKKLTDFQNYLNMRSHNEQTWKILSKKVN